jgi:nucleoid DNA-binding protein
MRQDIFISKAAKLAGCTQNTARNALIAFKAVVDEQLLDNSTAKLPFFGRFHIKKRKARYISQPKTHERMLSKEKLYIHFKASSAF